MWIHFHRMCPFLTPSFHSFLRKSVFLRIEGKIAYPKCLQHPCFKLNFVVSSWFNIRFLNSEVVKLLKQLNIPAVELRGLGIHISKLETGQPSTGLPSKSSILPFLSKTTKEMKTVASTSSVTMDSLSENQGKIQLRILREYKRSK